MEKGQKNIGNNKLWKAHSLPRNKREGFLTAVQSLRGNPQYTSDYWQLDAGFSYNITDDISVLVEGIKLTDENVDQCSKRPQARSAGARLAPIASRTLAIASHRSLTSTPRPHPSLDFSK